MYKIISKLFFNILDKKYSLTTISSMTKARSWTTHIPAPLKILNSVINAASFPERKFIAKMRKLDWRLIKRGWPDFFCFSKVGDKLAIMLVEVKKSKKDKLSPEQEFILKCFNSLGIPSFRYDHLSDSMCQLEFFSFDK